MTIRLPLAKLSLWQQVAFCCAILERMLPNYQMFSQAFEFGDTNVLRNQLNLLWQWLDKSQKVKINFDAQLLKLEEHVPDPEAFDTFGVFPAVDTCMALMSLMQGIQSKDAEELANVGLLSENSVRYFVELTLAQEQDNDLTITEQDIANHPLMAWEVATQNELFDFLKDASESKSTCQKATEMVLEEGLSNLGIEIN
jgi:uncharacterized protein